ncbi:MAG: hypothetical protein LAO78_09275 [Acidobacteriia bacterium]|nr:hypothetical protein [Terriglobia bacterium]
MENRKVFQSVAAIQETHGVQMRARIDYAKRILWAATRYHAGVSSFLIAKNVLAG